MYPAFAETATEAQKTLVRVAGFDYPKYPVSIEEPGAKYRFEVCVVQWSERLKVELSQNIEVACVSDSPAHIMFLVRTKLKGWRVHTDVPMKIIWENDF